MQRSSYAMKRIALGLAAALLGLSGVAGASVAIDTYVQDDTAGVDTSVDEHYVNCRVAFSAQTAGCETSAGNSDDLMANAQKAIDDAIAAADAAAAEAQAAVGEHVPPNPCSQTADPASGVSLSCQMTFPASPEETPEVNVPVDGLPAQNVLPPLSTPPIGIPSQSIPLPGVGTISTPSINIGSASIPAVSTPPVPGQTITVPSQSLPSLGGMTCSLTAGVTSALGFSLNGSC
jgi:hypothetical protein